MINDMKNKPAPVNAPESYLVNQAMKSAKDMETGDFRTLPKNMFFNFSRPAEEMKQYQMLTNAGATGTFGLADSNGQTKATALQGEYMKDKFARDSAQGFQQNVSNAADNVQNALAGASGMEAQRIGFENQREMGIMNALSNLYQTQKSVNSQGGIGSMMGGILGAAGSLGSAAITAGRI